ncbi:hypothetical protein [Clostridium hydrogenum]|uniref:hypothetical protein n=1 Tax=Clostridium hydrogenum TaxID=2855764 RepID=UPI001F24D7DD|nr:hypothetical protein [Clostridium hydrogenum]
MIRNTKAKYEQLYKKFLGLKLPYKFSLSEVSNILEKNYLAIEVPLSFHSILEDSVDFDGKHLVKCYHISDEIILDGLYSEEEKNINEMFVKINAETDKISPASNLHDDDIFKGAYS